MTTKMSVASAEEAQELVEYAKGVQEAERNWEALNAAENMKPTNTVATTAKAEFKNGQANVTSGRAVTAQVGSSELPEGYIRINGMVTTIAAAKAAGFSIPTKDD